MVMERGLDVLSTIENDLFTTYCLIGFESQNFILDKSFVQTSKRPSIE